MGYSNRKPYYGLDKGYLDYSKTANRYLKESIEKESQFEKPYLDLEYPSMQLRLPKPSWPSLGPRGPIGAFGEIARNLLARYIFPPPTCSASATGEQWGDAYWLGPSSGGVSYDFGLDCGDIAVVAFSANTSLFAKVKWYWNFNLSSDDLNLGDISWQEAADSISIWTDVLKTVVGTVLVCATGFSVSGRVHCCTEVEFICYPCIEDPAMAWDEEYSAETIEPNGSVNIGITGLNYPFTWSVSGTGFSLGSPSTSGVINTLEAGPDACGSATITVTGCDGKEVVGYVRGTEGEWIQKANGVGSNPSCQLSGAGTHATGSQFYIIEGNKKYTEFMRVLHGCYPGIEFCTDYCSQEGQYPGSGFCITSYDCHEIASGYDGASQVGGCCCHCTTQPGEYVTMEVIGWDYREWECAP